MNKLKYLLIANNKIILFCAVTWTLFVTILCLLNTNDLPQISFKISGLDKIVHFIFYFIFVILWTLYFNKNNNTKISYFIFVIAILYGISIELLQLYQTTTRSGDFKDVFANTLGAFSGILFTTKIILKK